MKTLSSSWLPIATILIAGTTGLGLGWWLGRSNATPTLTAPTIAAPPTVAMPIETPALPRSASISTPELPLAKPVDREQIAKVMADVFAGDTSDLAQLLESLGALTRLSNAEVRVAWNELQQRPPLSDFGSSLTAFFLWSRMNRMGETVALPKGWGAENFDASIQLEEARKNLPDLLARLNAGQELTEAERRAVFTDAVRKNPLEAMKLWRRTTKPEDYYYAAKYFANALANPETRAAIMAEVRAWQSPDEVARVTSALAQNWIARDPAAVEAWLKEPAQSDVRDALLWEVANMRVLTDPVFAWEWSKFLPDESRQHTLNMSVAQLANNDPAKGAALISQLTDPRERQIAVEQYARTLAANDLQQWEQWRNSLPEAERSLANESAFPLWAYNNVEQAVEWLNTQPEGEARSRMVANLVNIYAGRDPANAATWIQTITDPVQRQQAVSAALMIIGASDLNAIRTILAAAEN